MVKLMAPLTIDHSPNKDIDCIYNKTYVRNKNFRNTYKDIMMKSLATSVSISKEKQVIERTIDDKYFC
jgi:hypothetical protein